MLVDVRYFEKADVLYRRHRLTQAVLIERSHPVQVREVDPSEMRPAIRYRESDGKPVEILSSPIGLVRAVPSEKGLPWVRGPRVRDGEQEEVFAVGTYEDLDRLKGIVSCDADDYADRNRGEIERVEADVARFLVCEGVVHIRCSEPVLELSRLPRQWDGGTRPLLRIVYEGSFDEGLGHRSQATLFRLDHVETIVSLVERKWGVTRDEARDRLGVVGSASGPSDLEIPDPSVLRFDHDLRVIRQHASDYLRMVMNCEDPLANWQRSRIEKLVDLRDVLSRPDATSDDIATIYFALHPTWRTEAPWLWEGTRFEEMNAPDDQDAVAGIRW